MPARVLDGAAFARDMREGLRPQVEAFTTRAGRPPGLALVLVGDDPASHVYVGSKRTQATDVSFWPDFAVRPRCASVCSAARCSVSAAVSPSGKMNPLPPMTPGIAPLSEPITGRPLAIASTSTRPNCSFQLGRVRDGSTSTSTS